MPWRRIRWVVSFTSRPLYPLGKSRLHKFGNNVLCVCVYSTGTNSHSFHETLQGVCKRCATWHDQSPSGCVKAAGDSQARQMV